MNRKCIFTERVRINGGLGKPDIHSETKTEGTFTGWGIDFFEYTIVGNNSSDVGSASYTAGIIELPDGHVKLIRADDIQFVVEPVAEECETCLYHERLANTEPCKSCIDPNGTPHNWEPKP